MKAFKIIAFVLGGIVAVLVAVAIIAAATFDPNRFKSDIVQVVKEKKQRTLNLEGDIALSFWPSLGVQLGRATLSEHASEQPFAALESAHVSLAVMPLLRKQIVIDKLDFTGLQATLVKGKDGRLNIDDLLAKEEPPQAEGAPVRFDVAGVRLADARLAYRDEATGQSIALSDLDLDTGQLANLATGGLSLSGRLAVAQPRTDVALKLSADYDYDLDARRYGVKGLNLEAKGDAAAVQGLELALGAGTLRLDPAAAALEADKVSVAAKGKAGTDAFEVKLSAPQLNVTRSAASGEAMTAAVKLAGPERTVDAHFDLSGISGSGQAVNIARLALNLQAKSGQTALTGSLASPVAADLQALTVALSRLAGELTVAHPAMPMGSVKLPIEATARADFSKDTAAGNLNTRFDESTVKAKFSVAKFAPLALGFELDIDRLNVDKYFPPAKPGSAKAGGGGGAAPEKPIDLSALKDLNANGTVRIGALQVSNIKASDIRVNIKAADGRMDLAPLSAQLYEGSMSGSASVAAEGNRVGLKQQLSNVSINPLMRDAVDKDLLEGRGTVRLDVTTHGPTVDAMKKALAGSASVNLRDGAIKGINLAKSFRQAKARLSGREDAVQQASATEKTDFSEMSASFRIADGVARNNDLSLKSPLLRVGGEGDIDIGRGAMNYLAKATVVATSTGQEGKELADLKGIPVPVRVTGPFDQLSYRLEFGNLLADVAKSKAQAAVEEKKQELKEKARERLGEELKGLFGR